MLSGCTPKVQTFTSNTPHGTIGVNINDTSEVLNPHFSEVYDFESNIISIGNSDEDYHALQFSATKVQSTDVIICTDTIDPVPHSNLLLNNEYRYTAYKMEEDGTKTPYSFDVTKDWVPQLQSGLNIIVKQDVNEYYGFAVYLEN